jgi:hypothetical protein
MSKRTSQAHYLSSAAMARDDYGEGDKPQKTRDLAKVHARAIKRFDTASLPQQEIRAHALMCRRFISIPGAMWEGPWGEQFENSIRVEIDKLSKGVDKIVTDYRENRIVPDFRPSGGDSDQDTADTLDGVHRADDYHFKSQQARDNAYEEAAGGGFGAYRLCNELADPSDKDNDEQRVNPASIIVDADQRVFFDPNSKLYDKSDADWAFVLTADARESFEEEYPDKAVNFPENRVRPTFEWFMPDVVIKAEYYEVENVESDLVIMTQTLSGEQQREWADEIEPDDLKDLKNQGWRTETVKRLRKRVRKYLMSGAEVLEDQGYIAGTEIPIVPVYGKRWFVDNKERFRGFVSKNMDRQRIYNAKVSKLAEIDALAPREKPIFASAQLPPHLQTLWAQQEQERHPYALVEPLIDPVTGGFAAMGAIGKIEAPQIPPVTALLLQAAAADLNDETEDGADEVKANTSAEAMDIAATRIDAKSAIYLDNMRQSVQREGEIYLSMAKDVYYEAGRTIETMTEDGGDGEATLHEPITDTKGSFRIRNDFSNGRYKVIADVTETTATRREKTVKSMMNIAEVAVQAQDMEGAQAAIITATLNLDGEGLDDYQKWNRRRAIKLGLVEPNDEEKAELQQEAQAQQNQPDPEAQLAAAKAEDLQASAIQRGADAGLKIAQAHAIGGPDAVPDTPTGLEQVHTLAQIGKTAAETEQLRTQTAHLPQKLAIEGLNAKSNLIKAHATTLNKSEMSKRSAE